MAKSKAAPEATDIFTKGDVTILGVHFNDAWARSLKPRKIKPEDQDETSAEAQFLAENAHQYPDMEPADRETTLKKAFAACLGAKDPEKK